LDTTNRTVQIRLAVIDQLRGYTIFGMILVNFLGQFRVMPEAFRHHRDSMSYADTIAPLFLFVVGMGFRLSHPRRIEKVGVWPARWAAAKRYATLIVVGIMVYGPLSYRVSWWDALVDIGFAGLLALPFIEKPASVRILMAFVYLGLFQILFTFAGYGPWTMNNSIDGGPLGPLSWAFMLLLGTLAYDWLREGNRNRIILASLAWGVALSLIGWGFRAEWGEFKEFWPFSQKGMTIPYAAYSTGLCFLTFLFFYLTAEIGRFSFPPFTTLGKNPLTIYVLHLLLLAAHGSIVGRRAGMAAALAAFLAHYLFCYAVARRLEKDGILIKL
jgi:predicted acyltransferase